MLPWLILVPFLGGLLCWLVERVNQTLPRWIALFAMGLLLALGLWLWLQGDYRLAPSPAADDTDILLRLRPPHTARGAMITEQALGACLVERPDLHLQIEMRLVGSDSAEPVWSCQYVAGAEDLPARLDAVAGEIRQALKERKLFLQYNDPHDPDADKYLPAIPPKQPFLRPWLPRLAA